MRSALILLALIGMSYSRVTAQTFIATFDGEGFELDSIYPSSVWQVGPPQKAVFDSAYSAPNSLVTDTVLPYVVSDAISYAEFHLPIWFTGSAILKFRHRMDVEPGEASGWVEFISPWDTAWTRMMDNSGQWAGGYVDYYGNTGLLTDSGLVYSASVSEWAIETFSLVCIAVLWEPGDRGGGLDTTLRFRFAFKGATNLNGRDGWLIDNIVIEHWGPCSGVAEHAIPSISIAPNPADRWVNFDGEAMDIGAWSHQLISTDGRIRREKVRGVRGLDVSDLPNGIYVLRSEENGRSISTRLIVQH